MLKQPAYKRILSYLYPVRIKADASRENPVLELFLYRNQYQLATADALYSDGNRYRPLLIGFKAVGNHLKSVKNVLILGTGLGSAVQILSQQGYSPNYTLVDHDDTVLKWALELLPEDIAVNIDAICADAEAFIDAHDKQHDLLVVDIFSGRVVPAFATTTVFLQNCRRCLAPGGNFIFNYMLIDAQQWEEALANIRTVFPKHTIQSQGINRIIIATV